VIKGVAVVSTALIFVWGLVTFSANLGNLYLDSFPSIGIAATNATALLNATIQVDSILIGFLSIAFAAILSGLQSQISDRNEDIRDLFRVPPEEFDETGLEAYSKQISTLRKRIGLIVLLVGLFLIAMVLSIFSALSTLANISISLPRQNIASSVTPLFAGIIIIFAVICVGFAELSSS
jgi:hypothetical protein